MFIAAKVERERYKEAKLEVCDEALQLTSCVILGT